MVSINIANALATRTHGCGVDAIYVIGPDTPTMADAVSAANAEVLFGKLRASRTSGMAWPRQ